MVGYTNPLLATYKISFVLATPYLDICCQTRWFCCQRDPQKKPTNKWINDELKHVASWHRRTLKSKFTKIGEEMYIGQTHKHAKFCGNLQQVPKISTIKNLYSREKEPKFTKIFQGMLLTKAFNQPRFCRNRLKMWEISVIENWQNSSKSLKTCYP